MSAKPMLCSFKTCPWVQRAAIVLRAKNIDYDNVLVAQLRNLGLDDRMGRHVNVAHFSFGRRTISHTLTNRQEPRTPNALLVTCSWLVPQTVLRAFAWIDARVRK